MNRFSTGICSGLALACGLAPGAAIAEPTVEEIYSARYSVPLPPPLAEQGYFFELSEPAGIAVEAIYAAATSSLGWYAAGSEHALMDPLAVGQSVMFSVGPGSFGFWMLTEVGSQSAECYSDAMLNGGIDRVQVYGTPVPAEYFLAWEDCLSVDGDFNDVVLIGTQFAPVATGSPTWGGTKALYR